MPVTSVPAGSPAQSMKASDARLFQPSESAADVWLMVGDGPVFPEAGTKTRFREGCPNSWRLGTTPEEELSWAAH